MKRRVFFWVGIIIILSVFLFPIIYIVITSFKSQADAMIPTKLFFTPTLKNYVYEFYKMPILSGFFNSLIVGVISTILVIPVAFLAAYSFTRFNTGKGNLLFFTLTTRMFPPAIAAIPYFFIFGKLKILDTHFALILLYLYFNVSFATILLYGFLKEIPLEIEYAAMVDGYERLDIFRKIIIPLILPGLTITALFCFLFAWNEFFFGYIFTRTTARTVAFVLASHWGSEVILWGPMCAGLVFSILPTLIVGWFMQRYMIRGLTFGAVKG